jgi:hypothetical protein
MSVVRLSVLLSLGACAPLSRDEAVQVLNALQDVNRSIRHRATDVAVEASAKGLEGVATSSQVQTVSGELRFGKEWAGTITVEGEVDHGILDLSVELDEVRTHSPLTELSGRYALGVSGRREDNGDFAFTYDVVGEVRVGGTIDKNAQLDYAFHEEKTGNDAFSYSFDGEIGGREWTETAEGREREEPNP